jgi:hypothetical protein
MLNKLAPSSRLLSTVGFVDIIWVVDILILCLEFPRSGRIHYRPAPRSRDGCANLVHNTATTTTTTTTATTVTQQHRRSRCILVASAAATMTLLGDPPIQSSLRGKRPYLYWLESRNALFCQRVDLFFLCKRRLHTAMT